MTAVRAQGGSGGPATRGETHISPSVVEKIAARAAGEVAGVSTAEASGLRAQIASLTGRSAAPPASADVGRETTAVALAVSIGYPLPIRRTTERVREHVMHRVHELTGLDVKEVDIVVTKLDLGEAEPRRRVE
jgi:uncharacterized alkaline shock family protein YloU